jgi:hypothetical protein
MQGLLDLRVDIWSRLICGLVREACISRSGGVDGAPFYLLKEIRQTSTSHGIREASSAIGSQ